MPRRVPAALGPHRRPTQRPLGDRQAILVTTPDRRIHGAASNTAAGTRFAVLPTQTMTTLRGTYMHSRYRSVRYLVPPSNNYHQVGFITTMSTDEMKFIRAEALIRLNRAAEALALINPTRVAAGLRPVTVSGPPPGADCVNVGSCS